MNIDYIIVMLLLFLCILSIYTDLKEGLIYNKYLIGIGSVAIGLHVVSFFLESGNGWQENLLLAVAGTAFSFFLYYTKIWAGGDCKFYMIIALATPWKIADKSVYGISLILYVPVLAFLFGYLYLIVDSVREGSSLGKEERRRIGKRAGKEFIEYLKYYVAILFFYNITVRGLNLLEIVEINRWLLFGWNLLLVFFISRMQVLKYKSVVIAFTAADVLLGSLSMGTFGNLHIWLIWLAVVLSGVIRAVTETGNYETVNIGDVRAGMILSGTSSILLVGDKKSGFQRISDESLGARLTEEEAELLHKYSKKKNHLEQVNIVKKVPFALFIALATLVVLVGGLWL